MPLLLSRKRGIAMIAEVYDVDSGVMSGYEQGEGDEEGGEREECYEGEEALLAVVRGIARREFLETRI